MLAGIAQVLVRNHVDRHPALVQSDVGVLAHGIEQRFVDGLAGGIGRVGDAAHGVAAFTRQVQTERAARVVGERNALLYQPFNGLGTVFGNEAGRVFIHDAGAGFLGVVHMAFDAVIGAEYADDTALGARGGGFLHLALGNHDDGNAGRQMQGHGQARKPGAHDDDGEGRLIAGGGDGNFRGGHGANQESGQWPHSLREPWPPVRKTQESGGS